MNAGLCIGCGGKIPAHKRSDAKYCSSTCSAAAEKRRYRVRRGLSVHPQRGPYKVTRKHYEGKAERIRQYSKKRWEESAESKIRSEARKLGFRSGFERALDVSLKQRKTKYSYETLKIPYTLYGAYVPDFILDNGIIIEAKGVLDYDDRRKMLAVKQQHPELDIRIVFMNAHNCPPRMKSTNAQWAEKHGFPWAHKEIPEDWIK